MQVLALDIGEKRIGIASGNTESRIAMPLRVLPAADVCGNARPWRDILTDYEPELLVVGCPTSLSGEQGRQAERVRGVAEKIAEAAALPLEYVDERLSSAEAKRILREQGLSERDMRGRIDMVAASVFLQTWLDKTTKEES